MSKKIILLFLCLVLILGLCGCGLNLVYVIDEDSNISLTETFDIESYYIEGLKKQGVEDIDSLTDDMKLITQDGIQYYRQENTSTEKEADANQLHLHSANKDCFFFDAKDYEDALDYNIKDFRNQLDSRGLSDIYSANCTVTLPKKIIKTNGKLSNDGKTVSWNALKTQGTLYAYTADYKDTKKPVIIGVKKNVSYNRSVKIWFRDNSVITTARLDGKDIEYGQEVSQKGNHKVTVEDMFGNKTTVKFTIK